MFSFIIAALSVVFGVISEPVFSLCLTVFQIVTLDWLLKVMKKLTGKGKGRDYVIDNCFNNNGDEKQDYSCCEVNSSTSKDSYNNHTLGLQDFKDANIFTSATKKSFNNQSSGPQIFKSAMIGNSNEVMLDIDHAYNNN